MCRILKISESGYYRWLRNKDKPTKQELLLVEIRKILAEHPDNDNYGAPRMRVKLEQNGFKRSESTVRRAMKAGGLLHRRRKPKGLTKATTELQEKENIIKRDFSAEKPMTKLLTDITEIGCIDGKLYISPILDCCDGEIVSLEMRNNMKKELCIDTVKQLRDCYGSLKGVILHSDRGSQYTSEEFRKELSKNGMIQSLSGTGHCYDNARMESFFATLKKEKLYRLPVYRMTREEVKREVFRYIFIYYNRIRVYTSNPNGLPPVRYREKIEAEIAA